MTSGSRRFAWSHSTETTGSFVDKDCKENEDCDAATEEDMLQEMDPGTLYAKWEETGHA